MYVSKSQDLGPNISRNAFSMTLSAVLATSLILAGCSSTSLNLEDAALAGRETQKEPGTISADIKQQTPADLTRFRPTAKGSTALAEVHALRTAGRNNDALQRLEKVTSEDGNNLDLQKTRAMLALEVGHLKKAEELLHRAISRDKNDWRLYSALGTALSAQGRQQDAQIAYAKALELSPNNAAVLNNLALSYALDAKRKEAEALLRRIAESEAPKAHKDRARQNLALLLGLTGQMSEARKISETVMPRAEASANMQILNQATSVRNSQKAPRSAGLDQPIYRLGGPED